MTKSMTALAAVLVPIAGVAQTDTVKQIWNQDLGENGTGRMAWTNDVTIEARDIGPDGMDE